MEIFSDLVVYSFYIELKNEQNSNAARQEDGKLYYATGLVMQPNWKASKTWMPQ